MSADHWIRLIDQAAAEGDDAKRHDLYQQAQEIIMNEDAAYIPIAYNRSPLALSPRVQGFINPPEDWFQLWTVYVFGGVILSARLHTNPPPGEKQRVAAT
jgi:ABC-type transport system substrate-binding protein